MKELSEVLERHHRGKLPKSYYIDGQLYPKGILSGNSRDSHISQMKDIGKDRKAKEGAIEKMKNAPFIKEKIELKTEDLK